MTFPTFDKKRLAQDALSAVLRCSDGKKFVGHDGRGYAIVCKKPDSDVVIDVMTSTDGEDERVASYAVVLIRISR